MKIFQNASVRTSSFSLGVLLTALFWAIAVDAFNGPQVAPPGGAGAVAVDATGKVGIGGVPAPAYPLDVLGKIRTQNPNGGIIFPDATEQTTAYTGAAGAVVSAKNVTAEVFGSAQSNGKFAFPDFLGINTSTLAALAQPLSVHGNAYISDSLSVGRSVTLSPAKLTVSASQNGSSGSNPMLIIRNRRSGADSPAEIQFRPGNNNSDGSDPGDWWTLTGVEDSTFRLYRVEGEPPGNPNRRFLYMRVNDTGMAIVQNPSAGNWIDPAQSAIHIQGSNAYLQIDTLSAAPPVADCDNALESGRMKFDATNDILYICSGASGWVAK